VEDNKRAAFYKNNMEKEVPRFAPLEGTIDDFRSRGEQENKNTRVKPDRDVSVLRTFFRGR